MYIAYGAVDPRNNECSYVGITKLRSIGVDASLLLRLRAHYRTPERKAGNWLLSIKSAGLYPIMIPLEIVEDENKDEAEIFWVGYLKFIGAKLLNQTIGGKGTKGFKQSLDTKTKIKITREERYGPNWMSDTFTFKGGHHTENGKKRIGRYWKGRKREREGVERTTAFHTGRKRSEETCQRLKAAWSHDKHPLYWITDGIKSRRVFLTDPIPEGWYRGRAKKPK